VKGTETSINVFLNFTDSGRKLLRP